MALGGCGAAGVSGDDGGKVTLRFSWWGNDLRSKQTQAAIDAFESSHPNITIAAEPGQWTGYWDKLATMTAANNAPDVIQMDQQYIAEYGGRGALLDLSKQSVDTSKLDASAVQAGQVQGKQHGISNGQNAWAIMANTAVFAAAGVPLPDDATWTWDEYLEIAAKLAAKVPGNSGAAYGDLGMWLRQHGENMYTDDGKLGFSTGTVADYWTMLAKQRDAKAGPSAALASEDAGAALEQSLFGTGQLGMGWWWTNQLSALTASTKAEIKILRAPSPDGTAAKNGMYVKPSQFWSASSRTKHPKEAAEFINYLLNDVDAGKLLLTDRGFPPNAEVRTAITPQMQPADKKAGAFLDAIRGELQSAPPVPPVGTGTAPDVAVRYTNDVLFNRSSPQDAAAAFQRELQGLIDSGRK